MRRMLVMLALVLAPTPTFSQEITRQPLQELFLTEVVYPQERHEIQLTLGMLVDRSRPDLPTLVPLAMEYGITGRWQIEARWDGSTQFHDFADQRLRTARVAVGTKYSFMNIASSRVHAAVGVDAEFPRPAAFADDEGEDGIEIEPFVAVAADVWRRMSIFGSVGASVEPREVKELAQRGERPDDQGVVSFGALIAFRHATIVAEYTNRSDALPWRLDGAPLVTPSLVVRPRDSWEFAMGTPVGLRHASHRLGLVVHVVREF